MNLPSISDLFKQSWHIFSKSVFNLFILSIISVATGIVLFGVMAIVLILTIGGSWGSFTSNFQSNNVVTFGTLLGRIAPVLIIQIIFFSLIGLIVGITFGNSQILAVDSADNPQPISSFIKRGFKLSFPVILTSLLVGIFILGSFFPIPLIALLFSILFSFSGFEVILGNHNYLDAIRRSFYIISKNFGGILLRGFIFSLLTILIQNSLTIVLIFFPRLITIFILPCIILQLAFGWYALAFLITLYKHARSSVDINGKSSLKWAILSAVIGWIFITLIGFYVVKFIKSYDWNSIFKNSTSSYPYPMIPPGQSGSKERYDQFNKNSQQKQDYLNKSKQKIATPSP